MTTHAEAMAALERLEDIALNPEDRRYSEAERLAAILRAYMTPDPEVVRNAWDAVSEMPDHDTECYVTSRCREDCRSARNKAAICAALPPLPKNHDIPWGPTPARKEEK